MTVIYPSPIFGPVKSRRLGISLGINLMPGDGKWCSFDCLYCECGLNKDKKAKQPLPSVEEVKEKLEAKLKEMSARGEELNVLTFSGNGEPTMHPSFLEIVENVIILRNEYYPEAKVSVLSNATMLGHKDVAHALMKVDNPILKLDASSQDLVEKINKPVGSYRLDDVIRQLNAFEGRFILQTMFLKSNEFNTLTEDALKAWMDIVRLLKPRQVMVYTIDRETPDKTLAKCTVEEMTAMVQPLIDEGFDIQVRG